MADTQAPTVGGQPRLVLVVDDEPSIRGVLAGVLHDEGLAVAEARNGAEALELTATLTPALIPFASRLHRRRYMAPADAALLLALLPWQRRFWSGRTSSPCDRAHRLTAPQRRLL